MMLRLISNLFTHCKTLSMHNFLPTEYFEYNGRPRTPEHILMLISELEGSYQHLKFMGYKDDMDTLDEIKQRYYKEYFKAKKHSK